MDKTEARNILKTIQDECNSHNNCDDCVFCNGHACICEVVPYAYNLEDLEEG